MCRWVSSLQGIGTSTVPSHIKALLAPPGPQNLIDNAAVTVSDGFLELYEKRMEADYDHEAVFTGADTLGHIALAKQLLPLIDGAGTPALQRFFALIAFRAKIQDR